MKVYDKVKWHIDGGEDPSEVKQRFSIIMEYLYRNNMLNDNGKEIYQLNVDDESSLYDEMLLNAGITFMNEYYDRLIALDNEALYSFLNENH